MGDRRPFVQKFVGFLTINQIYKDPV